VLPPIREVIRVSGRPGVALPGHQPPPARRAHPPGPGTRLQIKDPGSCVRKGEKASGVVVYRSFGETGKPVDDLGDPEGIKRTGDDPEMADRNVGSFDELCRCGHSSGFSGKYKDLAVLVFYRGRKLLRKVGWILKARVQEESGSAVTERMSKSLLKEKANRNSLHSFNSQKV